MHCPFPDKARYSKNEAKKHLGYLQKRGRKELNFYRCPSREHWHIGRKR